MYCSWLLPAFSTVIVLLYPVLNTPLQPTPEYIATRYLWMVVFSHIHFMVFSRALGSGSRRDPARTPRRKRGPCTRSMAIALGVQSR